MAETRKRLEGGTWSAGHSVPKAAVLCLVKAAKGQRPAGISWLPQATKNECLLDDVSRTVRLGDDASHRGAPPVHPLKEPERVRLLGPVEGTGTCDCE